MSKFKENSDYSEIPIENIQEFNIFTKSQKKATSKILKIILYFFKNKPSNIPFKGFLLKGPPSTGKTELVKQIAKKVQRRLGKDYIIKLFLIDSSVIARPKWGEAEIELRNLFENFQYKSVKEKKILLFDDIDCLMIRRGSDMAKEWHYAINSVLFHLLDKLDPHNVIIIATTNRIDLIDDALKSRLFTIDIPYPNNEELAEIAFNLLKRSDMILKKDIETIHQEILNELKKDENYGLREIEKLIIEKTIMYLEED